MRINIDRSLLQDAVEFSCFRYALVKNIPMTKHLFIKVTDRALLLSVKRAMGADTSIVIPLPKPSLLFLRPGRCWVPLVKIRNLLRVLPERIDAVSLFFDRSKNQFTVQVGNTPFSYPAFGDPPHLTPPKPTAVKKDNVYHVDFKR